MRLTNLDIRMCDQLFCGQSQTTKNTNRSDPCPPCPYIIMNAGSFGSSSPVSLTHTVWRSSGDGDKFQGESFAEKNGRNTHKNNGIILQKKRTPNKSLN